ncbi:MAG: hypothetical protein U9Q68_10110 [Euryarchaeota archaeon]|nr:hypothetical protein [Euryarchaeota archaeon]
MNEERDGEVNPFPHDETVGIVEMQIAGNNPEETKKTLDRFIKFGYGRDEAIEKIGSVVVGEI